VAGRGHGRQARGAEPVQGDAGDGVGHPGQEQRHAGDVAVVLSGLVRAAHVDVLDVTHRDAGPLDRGRNRERGKIVGADTGEGAAVATDRRAYGGEDDRLGHRRAVYAQDS
jgi:hypothetical protein